MYFLFINKILRLNNLKSRTAMNAKISVFVICVEVIIYLLQDLHYCTINVWQRRVGSRKDVYLFFRNRHTFFIRVRTLVLWYMLCMHSNVEIFSMHLCFIAEQRLKQRTSNFIVKFLIVFVGKVITLTIFYFTLKVPQLIQYTTWINI